MQITLTFSNKATATFTLSKTDLSKIGNLISRLSKKAGVSEDKLIEVKIYMI